MTKEEYAKERKDPRWQRKRLEIMERDGFKCCNCSSDKETLNVHHRYYISGRKPWNYPDWAFETLCWECHEITHAIESTSDRPFQWWEISIGESQAENQKAREDRIKEGFSKIFAMLDALPNE